MRNPILRLFLLFVCSVPASVVFAQTSWKGTANNSWSNPANWTNGIPSASVDAIIGNASFTGPYQPAVSSTASCKSLTLGGTVNVTLTINKNSTINGDVLINSNGKLDLGKGTLSVNGDWTNNGTYITSGNNAAVIFGGTSQTLGGTAATTFRKLTVNAGSNLAVTTNLTIGGTGGGAGTLVVNGTLNPSGSPASSVTAASIMVGATGTLKVNAATFAANYICNSNQVTLSAGSTVDYAAGTNQTISSALVYSTLRISGSGVKSLAANLPSLSAASVSDGNILVVAGTLDLGTYTANRGTSVAGGNLKLSNGAALKIGGTGTLPANYAANTFALTSTVDYYGANQTVSPQTYGNLNLTGVSGNVVKTMPAAAFTVQGNLTSSAASGTLSYTAASNITVNGNLTIGTGATFNGDAYTHAITGNLVNSGTLTGAASTIAMAGAGTSISGIGTFNFFNLNITASNITADKNSSLDIAGNSSTTGSGIFTHLSGGTGKFTMSGAGKTISGANITLDNVVISKSVTTASSLLITGNLTVSGSLSATAGAITMSGAAKTISGAGAIDFYGLSIPGTVATGSTFTVSSALDISGSFTATAGTATFNNTATLNGAVNLNDVSLTGTLSLSTNAVLGIAGAFAITTGTLDVATSTPNTVIFNGTVHKTFRLLLTIT